MVRIVPVGSSYGIDVKEEKTEDATEVDIKPNMYPFDEADDDLDYSHDGDDRDYDVEIEIKKEQKSRTKKVKTKDKSKAKPKGSPRKHAVKSKGEDAEKEKKGDALHTPFVTLDEGGRKRYQCTICQKVFNARNLFSQHYKHVHLKLRPKLRSCYLCSVKVPTDSRPKHLEEAHGVPRPTCNACGKKFSFPNQVLRHHRAYHMAEKLFQCPICDVKCETRFQLKRHSDKHSPKRPYKCDYCDKSFKWKKNLKTHVMIHLDERPHVCDDVGEYVSVSGDNNKRFICKACEIAYRRLSDLRYHITRTHLKKKFIKCKHCAETFMYHSQRKCHVLSEHAKIKPEKFICDYCSRQFKRKNTLAEHVMDVHVEKKCSHCKLKFVRKRYLFHLNEAHGVAMPTCGVCGLRTLMESALIRHQRKVHLSEKNKICAVCKKGFYTESNLQDHMITHNQLKVFECDVCAKSFARRECFKAHYRIHTGERPYACKICALTFVQRASLRFHMKSHHQDINKSPQN
ncbi:hypothetical protein evm_012898 [Chilo suppressalis]|nr:hypothetical protein evm_012898 [Chilo suppressalis]